MPKYKIDTTEDGNPCVYYELTSVVLAHDEDGKVRVFTMQENQADNEADRKDIISRIESGFKVKLEI